MIRVLLLLVVGASVALGARVAYAGGGGGGGACRGPSTPSQGTEVQATRSCFAPMVLQVEPGAEVRWVNQDSTPHNVTPLVDGRADQTHLTAGQSTAIKFESPGVYTYLCSYHPGMIGVVIVSDGTAAGVSSEAAPPIAPSASAVQASPGPDGAPFAAVGIALFAGLLVGAGAASNIGPALLRALRLWVVPPFGRGR